jgi:hypothetical protein
MKMFSREDHSRLADLLESRYRDFPGREGLASWWIYMKSNSIRPLFGSYLVMREVVDVDDLDESVRAMQSTYDEVDLQIVWIHGLIGAFAIPKELALKVLVLGDFPPG